MFVTNVGEREKVRFGSIKTEVHMQPKVSFFYFVKNDTFTITFIKLCGNLRHTKRQNLHTSNVEYFALPYCLCWGRAFNGLNKDFKKIRKRRQGGNEVQIFEGRSGWRTVENANYSKFRRVAKPHSRNHGPLPISSLLPASN